MKKTIQSGDYHIKIVDGYLIFEGEGDSVIFPDDNENMVISSGSGSSDVILTSANATEGDVLIQSDTGSPVRLVTDALTEERSVLFSDKDGTLAYVDEVSRYVGTRNLPGITYDNPDITVDGTGVYTLFATDTYEGAVQTVSPSGDTFTIADEEVTHYLYTSWNAGSPILAITQDPSELMRGDRAAIARVIRTGTIFHTTFYNRKSRGLPEKIQQYLERTDGFRRLDGVIPSVVGSRNLEITEGIVSLGGVSSSVGPIDTSDSDTLLFVTWDGVEWVFTTNPQLNNTDYQSPTGVEPLSGGNRYAINWIWRGIEDQPHVYVLLGDGNYNLSQALNATVTTPPAWVSDHSVLVGRVIFQINSDTPADVSTIADPVFSAFITREHGQLSGLQGGSAGEHYHLSSEEYQRVHTSRYAHKPADTARASNNTLTDDPDLSGFSLEADAFYAIEGFLEFEADSAVPNVQWSFSETEISQNSSYVYQLFDTANTDGRQTITSTVQETLGAAAPVSVLIKGFVYTNETTAPTISFQWAQDTSDADNTTLKQGSWLRFMRK